MSVLTCGDNTAAFGGRLLVIRLSNKTGEEINISKAVFVCGPVRVVFENPVFPLLVNLTEQQTAQLGCCNTCYLAVWDEQGRKLTCSGSIGIKTEPRKV